MGLQCDMLESLSVIVQEACKSRRVRDERGIKCNVKGE